MKKTILLLLLLIGSILSIPVVSANPAVMIAAYTFEPSVLIPGDTALLTLTVKNAELTSTQTRASSSGDETVTTVDTIGATINEISITPAFSGTRQIRATTKYEDIGILAPGANLDVTFKIVADATLPEGIYFLTANIDVAGYTDVIYPIPIAVRNTTVDLIGTDVPSKLSMSGITEITLTVVNQRDAAVKGVTVTPHPIDGLEFIQESVYVGTVAAASSEEVTIDVRPLETGVKNLTFEMSYMNGYNQHYTSLTRFVEIIETLDVAPIITSFPLSIKKGDSAKISIEVYNAKTETITGVIVTPISNCTIIPSQYFIGSMDPDDVFSATFDIYTDTVDYGQQTIGFEVTFKQAEDYYNTPIVSHTFLVSTTNGASYSSSSGSSQGSNGMNALPSLTTCVLTLVLVLVVIIVCVLLFIRWRKKRKRS